MICLSFRCATPVFIFTAAILSGALCAPSAFAGPVLLYDYGTLGGTSAYATAINASGQVVGYSTTASGATHAFLLSAGHMTDLGTLGGAASYAEAINDNGTVVGYSNTTGSTNNHAFTWSGGVRTDIDGTSGASYAYAINNAGQIAGGRSASIFATATGFLDTGGVFLNTGSFVGAGINASGEMVASVTQLSGYPHAESYLGGVTTDLGLLAGTSSIGSAINSSGQIVGQSDYDSFSDTHAYLFSGGVMTDLGTLGGKHSSATAINSYGQVVGDAYSTANQYLIGIPKPNFIDHAFIYTNGVMIDLNDYISSGLLIDLQQAVAINDSGLIAINGTIANGSHHFFVMDTNGNFPVTPAATPEPGSVMLMSSAVAALWAIRGRKARVTATTRG